MSDSKIFDNKEIIKDTNLTEADHLVEQVTKFNNLLDSELIKNLSMLDELRELSKLSSLDKLENLDKLTKLSELGELEKLTKLSKLENLEKLDNLEQLDSLNKLDLLKNLEVINNNFEGNVSKLSHLDNLDSLKDLNKLDMLESLSNLNQLENLESIQKLDHLQNLSKLEKLEYLKDLNQLDRLDSFLQILKDRGDELSKLNQLDDLKNLTELNNLTKLDLLRELDNLKDLKFLERLDNLGNLEKMDELKELGELSKLEHLKKLESLNKLEELSNLEFLTNIYKLEKMSSDGTLEKLDKLDKIDILQTEKKKIVFTSVVSSILDFLKITSIVVILLFVVLKTNRDDSRLSLLQNIALNESDSLSITLPILRNSLTARSFTSIYEKAVTIYKNRVDRFWTPRSITGEKLDLLNNIWTLNFSDGSYDLTSDIRTHWSYLKEEAKTFIDEESKKINNNTTNSEKEALDLKRLKLLIFSNRCEESYKLASSFKNNTEWKTFINTSILLSLDCLRTVDKLPKDI